ncbi:MAG TPA: hypothetical protein VMA72_00045 [Streptosporangiaceae bacterium]|nr:hypothetical protein [Streptosporangiaceae bacterium]
MNPGGEPERDDTGLPPVDIEIPDDARELDRDVQAYHREQRAERRRLRHHRLHGRLTRDGIVLPLLACFLVLALITGTLLTVFTATSDQNLARLPGYGTGTSQPNTVSSTPAALAPSPGVVPTQRPLPYGTLRLASSNAPIALRGLGQSMLVLVPRVCRCGPTVSWLARVAASQHVRAYLVGTPQTKSEVLHLYSGLHPALRTALPVALDNQQVLPANYPVSGVTAVLVTAPPQTVSFAQNLSANDSQAPLVQALNG